MHLNQSHDNANDDHRAGERPADRRRVTGDPVDVGGVDAGDETLTIECILLLPSPSTPYQTSPTYIKASIVVCDVVAVVVARLPPVELRHVQQLQTRRHPHRVCAGIDLMFHHIFIQNVRHGNCNTCWAFESQ